MTALILVSLAAYTTIALLFKAASGKTQSDRLVTVALTVVTLITAVIMIVRGEWGGTLLGAAIALISGTLFYVASIYRVKALQTTPVSLVFALTNLDLVLSGAIALCIPAFGEPLTIWRVLAVLVAGMAILLGTQIRGIERVSTNTFLSLALLAVSATGFVIYARFFPTALLFFILLDHLAGVLLNGRTLRSVQRSELTWGAALGLCMFVGFWSLLQALAMSGSNLTLVLLALSMKTPFIALLAVPVFKERMTTAKLAAVGLATFALVMWELGTYL
jgi:drug/metabolite transporter (DMT)-like permease